MITEDYVSFETAKLLKEKGFKHWCYKCYGDAVYHKGVPISFDEECELKSAGLENEIEYIEGGYLYDYGCDNRKKDAKVWAAPTLQIAMKWLREVHNIDIDIDAKVGILGRKVYLSTISTYRCREDSDRLMQKQFELRYKDDTAVVPALQYFNTYEEAAETAIKYCLEKII